MTQEQKINKVQKFIDWLINETSWEVYDYDDLNNTSFIDFRREISYANHVYDNACLTLSDLTIGGYINDIGWGYTDQKYFETNIEEFKLKYKDIN